MTDQMTTLYKLSKNLKTAMAMLNTSHFQETSVKNLQYMQD